MTPLSPLDALGPAFRRTREVLTTPFRLGFFLKIALIAALTQPSFYSASVSLPMRGGEFALFAAGGHHSASSYGEQFAGAPGLAAFGVAALLMIAVIGLALWIGAAYLYCRLRFTVFDLVVFKGGQVRRAWSQYGRQAWRYFGLVLLAGLAFLVLAVLLVGPTVLNVVRVVRPLAASNPGSVNPLLMLGAMLPFLIAVFIVAALWSVVDALMQDFLLPPMALEDAPLESAFGRFFALLRSNFGSVALYILLRFAVGIGMTWIAMLGLFACLLLGGLAVFGLGMLLFHALWSSILGQVLCVALAIVAGLLFLVIYAVAMIAIYGTAAVFKQSYAAYFFGGRYPVLGDRLEPPPAVPVEVEPLAPPPAVVPPWSDAPPVW